ncbi:MAG: S16 family serine protease [Candidatus Micrarchaeota archaeon]
MKPYQILVLILAVVVIAFYFNNPTQEILQPTPTAFIPTATPIKAITGRSIFLKLPAINKLDEGVLAEVSVETGPGNGKVFIAFSEGNPFLSTDTQDSILTALSVAKKISGENTDYYNVYYTIDSDSQTVGGRSAGAAFTIATIAALNEKTIKQGILITGTIEEDGTIGKVGRIYEKALALKKAGFKTLIVPEGEGIQKLPREKCFMQETPDAVIHSCVTELIDVNVEKETGIQIIEVIHVRDAAGIMLE